MSVVYVSLYVCVWWRSVGDGIRERVPLLEQVSRVRSPPSSTMLDKLLCIK